jgi:alkyl hydroperoxide reductase subunit D
MSIEALRNALPDYAKDLKLNLDSVLTEAGAPGLTSKQIHAIALASALVARYRPLTQAIEAQAATHLDPVEINGAKAAAAVMGMTNIYYRFTHLVENQDYASMRTSLRMNVMANPGIDKLSFELASVAASAIKGCGQCLDSHEKVLRKHEVPAQAIQSAVRIASVVHAIAVVLEQEGIGG